MDAKHLDARVSVPSEHFEHFLLFGFMEDARPIHHRVNLFFALFLDATGVCRQEKLEAVLRVFEHEFEDLFRLEFTA